MITRITNFTLAVVVAVILLSVTSPAEAGRKSCGFDARDPRTGKTIAKGWPIKKVDRANGRADAATEDSKEK